MLVPSMYLPASARVKELLVEAQAAQLRGFKCMFFEMSLDERARGNGRAYCPYFNECLYAHFVPMDIDRLRSRRFVFTEQQIEQLMKTHGKDDLRNANNEELEEG